MKKQQRSVTAPRGFRAAGGVCGIKASGNDDLAMIVSDVPARCAAMFTTNAVVGAPVIVGRQHTRRGTMRAIVCNSGVANVATGQQGLDNAIAMCQTTAKAIGGDPYQILPASTGVIGHQLPIKKILTGITTVAKQLDTGLAADASAAQAILTTDTRPKSALRKIKLGQTTVTIGGIAKGSGMIAPNMATMLVFITTDADIATPLLRRALKDAVNADASFNRISVDSDTSTSDTIAVMANGQAGNLPIRKRDGDYEKFAAALADICRDLAYQVIADGEGLEHVIHVTVDGAATQADALRVARSVADSPLVKTAVHGCDPNWGRLAMAAGKSGAKVDPTKMTLRIGKTVVFRNGKPTRFDPKVVSKSMKSFDVPLRITLGLGEGSCIFLGCDLSREYITINADYHT